MDDGLTYFDDCEHALVRLFKAYKPVTLLFYSPDISRALQGVHEGPNVGIWLSDEIPCSEYFVHSLLVCSMIDRTFGRGRYNPVVLNSASDEIRRLFLHYGCMVYARGEPDRISFMITANSGHEDTPLKAGQKRDLLRLGSKIVEFNEWALLKRDSDRKGLLIDFRPPTVHA